MGKVSKIILAVVVGFVVFVSLGLFLRSGAIIGGQLESAITNALGTPAQIEAVNLNPFVGKIAISKITISNPGGLSTPYFMAVKDLAIKIKPLSLWQSVVEIEDFTINNWDINIEQTAAKGNLSEIVKYVQNKQPQTQSQDAPPASTKKVASSKVTIGQIKTQIKLSLLNLLNLQKEFIFDNIALTNVNSDNAAAVLLDQYVVRLVSQTLKAVLMASKQDLQSNLPFLKNDPHQFLQELIDRLGG